MKKYIVSSMVLAGMMLASCSLEETPLSKFDESEAYKSSTLTYINTVANVYSNIGNNLYGGTDCIHSMNMLTSDMTYIPGRQGDWVDGGKWQNLTLHNFAPSLDMFSSNWNHIFSIVALCNSSIEKLESIDADTYKSYISELRALRALYYYYAMDAFGSVPVVTAADQSVSDVSQSTRPEVFKFIMEELNAALPNLSDASCANTGEYYGRVTKGVVYMCVAQMAINAPVYNINPDNASSYADFVGNQTDGKASETLGANVSAKGKTISMTFDGQTKNCWDMAIYCADKLADLGYELAADYSSNFAVANETSKENIWIRPNDYSTYKIWDCNSMRSWHYNHAGAMGYSGWNGPCASVRAMHVNGLNYDDETLTGCDPRLKMNYYTYTDYADECGIVNDGATTQNLEYLPLLARVDYNTTMQKAEGWSDTELAHIVKCGGARFKKYAFDAAAASVSMGCNQNDLVLWRYADALLIKAEAEYRLGYIAEARNVLNLVRERAGAKDIEEGKLTLNTILDERMIEFAWEGNRRADQVRFCTWTEPTVDRYPDVSHNSSAGGWNTDLTGYTCVFPIPQSALDLNKQLKQNPGY